MALQNLSGAECLYFFENASRMKRNSFFVRSAPQAWVNPSNDYFYVRPTTRRDVRYTFTVYARVKSFASFIRIRILALALLSRIRGFPSGCDKLSESNTFRREFIDKLLYCTYLGR